jgi:molybdopterin/thiamine biosynthesis adenylyltransferase
MSLASPISDRTGRFMQAALQQNDSTIQAHICDQHVQIELDPRIAESLTGQIILFTLLNLLVRLDAYCPCLEVGLPSVERHPLLRLLEPRRLADALDRFFAPFPAAQHLIMHAPGSRAESSDLRLVISPRAIPGMLSIWADGWVAYLNEDAPDGGIHDNTVGASVAATLAAAEVFKRLIGTLPLRPGIVVMPTRRLVFSTYDYGLEAGPNPPLPPTVALNGTIVGLGGIGSAFIAAAASLPAIAGDMALVDKDTLDDTSLNRFLIARPGDSGFKVELCQQALAFHPGVQGYAEWFDTFVAQYGDRHDIIVVGVDNDPVRRAIQATRPRLVLNAGTSDVASFRVTRHDYVHGACLSCIARAGLVDHPVERELARQLGLDLTTVLDYQASGRPLPAELLRQSGALDEENVQRLADYPLADIQRWLCGQVVLGVSQQEAAVSISFLSALPGFLLLGELIKEQNYPQLARSPLNEHVNHMLLSVLGRPHPALLHGWRAKRSDCDCTRPAYERAYARKWR